MAPSAKQIHRYTTEELNKAAKNGKLNPNQRLTALELLVNTTAFKKLTAEERVIYFTDICDAASKQIEWIQRVIQEIQKEIHWNDEYLAETSQELRKIPPELFDVIKRTQEKAAKLFPDLFSTNKTITGTIHKALQQKGKWDVLYDAIQSTFNKDVSHLGEIDCDFDDLFNAVFEDYKCTCTGDIITLFKNQNIKKLEDLGALIKS